MAMASPVLTASGQSAADVAGESAISRPRLESRRQLPGLTGLRFFAAFFILFAHACDWIAQFQNSNVREYFSFVAMYGMPLFFVLSGFVIHYNYRDLFVKAGLARAICEFAAARFARLYPLYFCCLVLALGADEFVQNNYSAPKTAASILTYYLTLTQSWWYLIFDGKSIIFQLFSVSWSISTEMYFYLLYATLIFLILAVFRLGRTILMGVVYAIVVFAVLWFLRYNIGILLNLAQRYLPDYIGMGENASTFEHSFYRWLFYFSPYVRVLEFFMGCFAAQVFIEIDGKPVSAREHRRGLVALLVALVFLAVAGLFYLAVFNFPLLNMYTQFFALNFLCAPAIAVILFCVARYDTPFARFMSSALLVGLGETSYSIYLVHSWTLRIFEHAVQPFTVFWALDAAFRVGVAIAFTLLVSYATYQLIELPGRARVRGALRRLIVRRFGWSDTALATKPMPKPLFAWPGGIKVLTDPAGYTVAVVLTLVSIAVAGQAVSNGSVIKRLRHLFVADRSEIRVISADYGLNCSAFPVPSQYTKLVSPGYATKAVQQACDGESECEYVVSVSRLGDPANGCGKEFAVKYSCSEHTAIFSAFISGEADGKEVVLSCR